MSFLHGGSTEIPTDDGKFYALDLATVTPDRGHRDNSRGYGNGGYYSEVFTAHSFIVDN